MMPNRREALRIRFGIEGDRRERSEREGKRREENHNKEEAPRGLGR